MPMKTDADPLEGLFANRDGTNRELLAELLRDRVRLDKAGEFNFMTGVRGRLGGPRVVLVCLLARKALALTVDGFTEGVSPRELEAVTGIAGGTLRSILKRFADRGLICRRPEGYLVPNYALENAANELRGGE
jgi:DNA-binding transcriptional ArsR family regulator